MQQEDETNDKEPEPNECEEEDENLKDSCEIAVFGNEGGCPGRMTRKRTRRPNAT